MIKQCKFLSKIQKIRMERHTLRSCNPETGSLSLPNWPMPCAARLRDLWSQITDHVSNRFKSDIQSSNYMNLIFDGGSISPLMAFTKIWESQCKTGLFQPLEMATDIAICMQLVPQLAEEMGVPPSGTKRRNFHYIYCCTSQARKCIHPSCINEDNSFPFMIFVQCQDQWKSGLRGSGMFYVYWTPYRISPLVLKSWIN